MEIKYFKILNDYCHVRRISGNKCPTIITNSQTISVHKFIRFNICFLFNFSSILLYNVYKVFAINTRLTLGLEARWLIIIIYRPVYCALIKMSRCPGTSAPLGSVTNVS